MYNAIYSAMQVLMLQKSRLHFLLANYDVLCIWSEIWAGRCFRGSSSLSLDSLPVSRPDSMFRLVHIAVISTQGSFARSPPVINLMTSLKSELRTWRQHHDNHPTAGQSQRGFIWQEMDLWEISSGWKRPIASTHNRTHTACECVLWHNNRWKYDWSLVMSS